MSSDRVIWLPRGWQPVHIGFCPSEKAWEKVCCKLGYYGVPYPQTDASANFFERTEKANASVIVCLNRAEEHDAISVSGLLLHEAVHARQFCCKQMGEPCAGIEVEAYSIQAITQELMIAYEKVSGKRFKFVDPKT